MMKINQTGEKMIKKIKDKKWVDYKKLLRFLKDKPYLAGWEIRALIIKSDQYRITTVKMNKIKSILDAPYIWLIAGAIMLGLSIDVSINFFKGVNLTGGVWLLIEANNRYERNRCKE